MKNEKVKAIIRLIVTAALMVNMGLTIAGKNPIPFDEAQLTEWLTVAASGLSVIWSWWKNAPMTKAAQKAQDVLDSEKANGGAVEQEAQG